MCGCVRRLFKTPGICHAQVPGHVAENEDELPLEEVRSIHFIQDFGCIHAHGKVFQGPAAVEMEPAPGNQAALLNSMLVLRGQAAPSDVDGEAQRPAVPKEPVHAFTQWETMPA